MNQTKRRGNKRRIPKGVAAVIIIFLLALGLLFIHNENVKLNQQVLNLQERLDQVNSEIDSKEGQIMSNADLKAVETQARALGMTEPNPNQYIYEAAAQKQTVLSDSPVGLYDYLMFFQQLRNERLWPQELQ